MLCAIVLSVAFFFLFYAECRYAECRGTLECHLCQMLSMLSVANKPFMLRVVMLNVVMLNVMAPKLKLRFPERL
jgi:hypothetical protein